MRKFFDEWRFYSFGKEQYHECMNKVFITNLNSLKQANILVVIFTVCFSFASILMDIVSGNSINLSNIPPYLIAALFAFVLSLYMNYKMQTGEVTNKFIYVFMSLFCLNVIVFSLYLCVWQYPDHIAAIYLPILVCLLLMFINPPSFNLCIVLLAMVVLIICSLIKKETEIAIFDIFNTVAAGMLAIYFNWHINKLRMGMEISSSILEDERNKYLNESTVDELTQLNNRRDFMATFKRYLHNYRTSDDFLCIAISDIDFFKNYNDHYGHPQGDECLRGVGRAFAKLRDDMGVYVARVGGEEFAMLWFEKDSAHVNEVVNYFFSLIKDMKQPHVKSKVSDFVTMSVGVYIEKLGVSHEEEALYELADNALYAAKNSGRNCAIITGREKEQYKITPSGK